MGVATVIKDYGTDILNAIRENDLQKLKAILEKHLKSDHKIAKLCVSDIKHRPTKKFACPLILASRQDDARVIRYMMEKGVDPNFVHHTIFSSKRREIVTALHIAVDLGLYDTVEILMSANADANIGDHNKETPLHIAVKKSDRIMTRMLLSKGANASIVDQRGNAALHIATLYGHLQLVRTMLKYDADVYQKGQFSAIPPHIAAKEGHIHLIQLFCSRDVGNINIKIPCYTDMREKAPIHLAAENGHIETVRSLISQFDADVNLKDSDGNTPLHCCVLNPYDPHQMRDKDDFNETARVLVKNRVSINEKNVFGDAAIHLAAMNHFQRIVELLLEVGANPFLENEEGLKPIDVVPDSDPVTKNVLKMAMLNPKPLANLNYSLDTLQRDKDNTLDSNMRHAMLADGVVLSSSQGTPENALDQSLSMRSVSASSFPSVFDENGQAGEQTQQAPGDSLGRVPVKIQGQGQQPNQGHGLQPNQGQGQGQPPNQGRGQQPNQGPNRGHHPGQHPQQVQGGRPGQGHPNQQGYQQHTNKRHPSNQDDPRNEFEDDDDDFDDEDTDVYKNLTENEIPTYTAVDKKKKKRRDKEKYPDQNQNHDKYQDDDTISFTTQSSMQDDASSVFSMGAGNANAVVQREIQKLFSKQQTTQKKKKKKPRQGSDTSSFMDDTSIAGTDPQHDDLEHSITASMDSQSYMQMEEVEARDKKKKKKRARDPENKENIKGSVDPYRDDKVIYENLSNVSVSESQASIDIKKKKTKKNKSRSKLDDVLSGAAKSDQQMMPYSSNQGQVQPQGQGDQAMQPGSVKVNTVPGKPGTIEVQYSGGPITISVDTSHVDQLADGQYYFTDQHGNQFPVDVENAHDLAALQQLTQQNQQGKKQVEAPSRPPKAEPIYANQEELFGHEKKGRRPFRPAPPPPDTMPYSPGQFQDISGITNGSVHITEMDDTQQSADIDVSESDEVNDIISQKVKEVTQTPTKSNLSGRGTPTKQSGKPAVPSRGDRHRGTPTKLMKQEANEQESQEPEKQERKPPKPMVVTRAVSNQEEEEEDWNASPDESPNMSPQYKTFAQKLMWAQKTTADKPPVKSKPARPPLKKRPETEETSENQTKNENLQDDEDDDSTTSSSSEGESVIASPLKKKITTKGGKDDHQKMYSITPEIDLQETDSDSSSSSSDGQSSVVHKPKPEPRKIHIRETKTEVKTEVVTVTETKHDEMTKVHVVQAEEVKNLDVETYEKEPGARKPRARPRKPRSKKEVTATDEEPLPISKPDNMTDLNKAGNQDMDNSLDDELEKYEQEPGSRRLGRSLDRVTGVSSPCNGVSTGISETERAQSVDSIASDYSEGGTRRLNMRVTGPVPKAYNRRQKDGARTAFILKPKPEGIESGSEASDAEMGSRGSLSARVASPESAERAKRWSTETKPIHSKSPEGLLPRSPSSPASSLSPVPPGDKPTSKNKTKLIGSYAKPYKTFGKIEVKTDAIEEALINSPLTSPLSPRSLGYPIQQPTHEESFSDKSMEVESPATQRKLGVKPATFPPSDAKVIKTSPEIQKANILRPQPVTAQPIESVITCSSLADENSLPNKLEEAKKLKERPQPGKTTAEFGVAKSAFKKNIKVMETGPETYESVKATQPVKKKKTVSVRELKLSESGEMLETVTTTVVASKTEQLKPMKVEVFTGESSSETETSESEEDSSESSDEGVMEYKPEQQQNKTEKSEAQETEFNHVAKRSQGALKISGDDQSKSQDKTKEDYEHYDKEPGARRPRPRPRSRSSQPEQTPDETIEKQDQESASASPPAAMPKETNFEHYESEPGARRPKAYSLSTKDTAKEKPVPRPRSANKDSLLQSQAMMETDLDEILGAGQPIPSNEGGAQDPLETSFDQYEQEPGMRRPRPKPSDSSEPIIHVTEAPLPQTVPTLVMATAGQVPDAKQPEETTFDQYEEEPGARRRGRKADVSKETPPVLDISHTKQDHQLQPQPSGQGQGESDKVLAGQPTQPDQPEPKKERIKGRRQIGQPKRGQQELLRTKLQQPPPPPPTDSRQMNTSFGPEDEEVANINSQAKARKQAIKAKKLREHEWAMQQKVAQEEASQNLGSEWDQALMAAQAQHGKVPPQFQKTPEGQVITPIPGVEITVTGDVGQVSGPDQQENKEQVIPKSLLDKSTDSDKGGKKGFLKFPSKRKKKDKDNKDKMMASAEDLTSDGEGKKKGLFGRSKKKQKDQLNTSIASSADEEGMYESLTDISKAGVTPENQPSVASPERQPSVESNVSSPEGYGIEQTVMGAKVERDDTVKQRPDSNNRKGGFFNMPSIRKKKKDTDEEFGAVPYDEAPEVQPKQSGLSQDEILASMMQQKKGGRQARQGARQAAMDENIASNKWAQQQGPSDKPPPVPSITQRPPIQGIQGYPVNARPKPMETGIDDDLNLPDDQPGMPAVAIQPGLQKPLHEPMETNIDDDLPISSSAGQLQDPAAAAVAQNLQQHGHYPQGHHPHHQVQPGHDAQLVAGMWQQQHPQQHPQHPQQQYPQQYPQHGHQPPQHPQQVQETNLDALPTQEDQPQAFNRNQPGRVSRGRRKGKRGPPPRGSGNEEIKDEPPAATSSAVFEDAAFASITADLHQQQHNRQKQGSIGRADQMAGQPSMHVQRPEHSYPHNHQRPPPQPVDDTALVSQLWTSKKDQEEDMMRVLESTRTMGNMDEANLYEQPVCHQSHSPHTSRKQGGHRGGEPHHPPQGNNGRELEDVAMDAILQQQQQPQRSQAKPPLPTHKPRAGAQPKTFNSDPNRRSNSLPRPRAATVDDATAVSQMWSQQQGKAEVVEMPQPSGGHDPYQMGSPPTRDQAERQPRRGRRGPRPAPHSTSSLQGILSDSESLRQQPKGGRRRRNRRGISFEADYHSEAEMHDYEPPAEPRDPDKSLQEAALESITAGLQNQPKIKPYRPMLPDAERQVNYTRGVYRPKPLQWRGSSRSSTGSVGRYDDSSLVSQLWSERNRPATTESEGEADTEEPSFYEDSPQHHSLDRPPPLPATGPPPPQPGHPGFIPQGHGYPPGPPPPNGHYPGQPPPSPRRVASGDAAPVKRRPKKKKRWVTEPGPVNFSDYGPTAKIWMEQVDEKTVQKSQTMLFSVMPVGHKFPDMETSIPADTTVGDDEVFLPPQWVIARGRNMRRKKRQLDRQRQSGASSGGSDFEGDQPMTPGNQMLLFFRVGSNWRDLAWILFDGIQNDSETIRMLKDIQIKSPNHLTNQVHDLMHRWWKKKGHEATIEELRRALDLVHIPYIMEDCSNKRSSVTAYSGSEDNLDISQISDQDPDVSRLIQEYEVRSLNASYEGGALSDSGVEAQRRSYNLSSDSLVRRLNEKGVTINRSGLGSRSSLGRSSRNSSRGHDSMDESVDYYSDGESRRSFVIVQPQLKSGDYRHETNL